EIETQMQRFYQSLSEKDSRRYAAIEALKLGYGGIRGLPENKIPNKKIEKCFFEKVIMVLRFVLCNVRGL
ncbi:MAG: hypothetical protein ACKO7A_24225, partial [Microcystis sp.]